MLSLSWETAKLIEAGHGSRAPPPGKPRFDCSLQTDRCVGCGIEYVGRDQIERVASQVWEALFARPASLAGRPDDAVRQALRFATEPPCRMLVAQIDDALRMAGFEVVDDMFQRHHLRLATETLCDRCGGSAWDQPYHRVEGPPIVLKPQIWPRELEWLRNRASG